MKLRINELEFLSTWAREEKAADPYALPAHQLQAVHQVPSVTLIRAIKAWARAEGKRDEEIFTQCSNPSPQWPWPTPEDFRERTEQILRSRQDTHKASQAS